MFILKAKVFMHDFHGATQREGALLAGSHGFNSVGVRIIAVNRCVRRLVSLSSCDVDTVVKGCDGETP